MPSQLHEVLVAMLREQRSMTRALTELAMGTPLGANLQLRTRDQNFSEVQPPEYRADLVLELFRDGESHPQSFVILEVQLTRDKRKRLAWPAYQAVLRSQYDAPVTVIILAPSPRIARWCSEPVDLDGHGMCVFRPWVIGPDLIPVITDVDQAIRSPGLAALSAIAHGRGERGYDVGRAGLVAADSLDGDEARLYADLVLNHVDPATRDALEQFMALKLNEKYEYQSPTARRFVAEGRAEGQVRSVLLVLESRGFHPDAELRARIEQAAVDELDVLVSRAAVIDALEELFESG